jgi:hypothetical protein
MGQSVCKCVPHTPKLKLHIVPNVCITWKDLTREVDETVWNSTTHSIPPNLNASTLVLEKQNTKITMENKNKIKKNNNNNNNKKNKEIKQI